MSAVLRSTLPYIAFARVSFLQILAYRSRYFTGIVTYLVNVTVYYFIWTAIYSSGRPIRGFTLAQMITYVAIGWIIRSFYYNNIDREIATDVQLGHIAAKLTRPVNYQWMQISQAAGESFFRMIMFTVPTAAVILLIYHVQTPAAVSSFFAFLVALLFSFFIFASINFIIGTFAVYLHSILGLIRAKYFLIEIMSGLIIPIDFFPDPLIRVSRLLPFHHISYTPLMIYMGKIQGAGLAQALAVEVMWCIGLALAGKFLWKRATHKLIVQGG
jgi:viologen exporter family transport system permease protein